MEGKICLLCLEQRACVRFVHFSSRQYDFKAKIVSTHPRNALQREREDFKVAVQTLSGVSSKGAELASFF